MSPRLPSILGACVLGLCCSFAAAQAPALTLESLPRPATPPAELGPVVPAQVQRWRQEGADYEHGVGVPPYAETRHYVQRILSNLGGQRSHPFDPAVTPPSGVLRTARDAARPR